MLETVSYAARLSKSYMLPVGAPPEEQAAQSAAWNAVVVYAAMLSSLEYLCHLYVELESGKRWFPLLDAPSEPYRFHFMSEQPPVIPDYDWNIFGVRVSIAHQLDIARGIATKEAA